MKSPAFQFYPAEWLSSAKVTLMTPSEEGAYIRLLCHCWGDPDCSIPDDDDQLAVLSRLGELWFKGSSTKLRQSFEPHPDIAGRLVNARLLKERIKQANWRAKCQAGGVKSGESRKRASKTRRVENEQPFKGSSRVVELKRNSSASAYSSASAFSSKKRETAPSPKTLAPESFSITDKMRSFAAENAPGIDIACETDKYLDYHRAKQSRFADWPAAWRNWIRKAAEFAEPQSRNGHGGREAVAPRSLRVMTSKPRIGQRVSGG